LALLPATRISVAPSSSVPPAIAVPSTAAMSGTAGRHMRHSDFHGRSASAARRAWTSRAVLEGRRVRVATGHVLEVRPRAEVATRSRQDQAADVGILIGHHAGVVEADEHLAIDGVLSFGSGEGDDQRVTVAFGEHGRHGLRT